MSDIEHLILRKESVQIKRMINYLKKIDTKIPRQGSSLSVVTAPLETEMMPKYHTLDRSNNSPENKTNARLEELLQLGSK